MQARASGNAALERRLSGELLESVRPIIRRVVGAVLPFAGSLSAEDLSQVAAMTVLRTVAKYDFTRGSQSFGDVVFFRMKTACQQFPRLHGGDVHVSDWEHKGRTARSIRGAKGNRTRVHCLDIPSHFSDGGATDDLHVCELEVALREVSGRDADDETPEARLLAAERRALVFDAVRRLPREQRELVSRVFGLGGPAQSVRAVAESWGAPKSLVARMLARVLEELRDEVAGAR
ncbi:sigma-70 family RNA polymerase sigma factor [Myxococcus landrumensis]|uniref:Sigma-70 family RNA polymerase sigma factor n=2 Tax=Myxococcus landrumensis TaxID=2813577 RepID=A0ABX7NHB2_9BACT|nr:sigma-70 family RNA polymerase sigma factor [Myxococcus landrumus]